MANDLTTWLYSNPVLILTMLRKGTGRRISTWAKAQRQADSQYVWKFL